MNFQTYTQDFTQLNPQEAQELLTAKDGDILFIGRSSCPYCNLFIPKLHKVAQDQQLTIHFLDSTQPSPQLQALRDHYQVPTVPGLLIAKSTGVEVRCDSSMTPDQIRTFLQD